MKWLDIIFKLSVVTGVIAYLCKELFVPSVVLHLNKDDFMAYSKACAQAMDGNWYIEQEDNNNLSKSSNIQLLDCHEYDMLQKHMLKYGVSEYALSELGLKALELHQRPASEIAKQHKFTER